MLRIKFNNWISSFSFSFIIDLFLISLEQCGNEESLIMIAYNILKVNVEQNKEQSEIAEEGNQEQEGGGGEKG